MMGDLSSPKGHKLCHLFGLFLGLLCPILSSEFYRRGRGHIMIVSLIYDLGSFRLYFVVSFVSTSFFCPISFQLFWPPFLFSDNIKLLTFYFWRDSLAQINITFYITRLFNSLQSAFVHRFKSHLILSFLYLLLSLSLCPSGALNPIQCPQMDYRLNLFSEWSAKYFDKTCIFQGILFF